jgi:uncharacterized protein (TIGR00251 family)
MSKTDDALISYIKTLTSDCFIVHVSPNASANKIKLVTDQCGDQSDDTPQIRIYVTTPPEDGKANKAVIKLLARALNVPKSAIEVKRGEKSRVKTIQLNITLKQHLNKTVKITEQFIRINKASYKTGFVSKYKYLIDLY